jgi:hypothetical protein
MIETYNWPELEQFALETLRILQHPSTTIHSCAGLLPHLEAPYRTECAVLALQTLAKVEPGCKRAKLLQELSACLPDEAFETAIGLVAQIIDPECAARAGISLLEHAPARHVPELIRIITRSAGWVPDEIALRIITKKATDPELATTLLETFAIAPTGVGEPRRNTLAPHVLAPYLGRLCTQAPAASQSYYSLWHDLLVSAAYSRRTNLLDTIRELLPVTEALGGLECIEDISASVTEITNWWP